MPGQQEPSSRDCRQLAAQGWLLMKSGQVLLQSGKRTRCKAPHQAGHPAPYHLCAKHLCGLLPRAHVKPACFTLADLNAQIQTIGQGFLYLQGFFYKDSVCRGGPLNQIFETLAVKGCKPSTAPLSGCSYSVLVAQERCLTDDHDELKGPKLLFDTLQKWKYS